LAEAEENRRRLLATKARTSCVTLASKRVTFHFSLKNGLRRFGRFRVSARRSFLFGKFPIYPALIRIFFAVVRRNVWWILIEVGSSNPKFLAMRVDPLPHAVA